MWALALEISYTNDTNKNVKKYIDSPKTICDIIENRTLTGFFKAGKTSYNTARGCFTTGSTALVLKLAHSNYVP